MVEIGWVLFGFMMVWHWFNVYRWRSNVRKNRRHKGDERCIKSIGEQSTKVELTNFLIYHERKGKNVDIYKKWIVKMKHNNHLPKPVWNKLIRELGIRYEIKKSL